MSETAALKRPFLIGVLAVGIVLVLVTGVIAAFSSIDDRPEGVAERWLTAVGDLSRDGVHADAVDRVQAHGDVALGEHLIAGAKTDGKTAFTALEVGKARRDGDTAFVPAQFVTRGTDASRSQLLVLHRAADSWRVVDVRPPDPVLEVPSEGGDVASKAPLSLYLVALAIGVGIAVAASALVRAAGREHDIAVSDLRSG
jgi:hypothetical protein